MNRTKPVVQELIIEKYNIALKYVIFNALDDELGYWPTLLQKSRESSVVSVLHNIVIKLEKVHPHVWYFSIY